jgi:hypothetical protein
MQFARSTRRAIFKPYGNRKISTTHLKTERPLAIPCASISPGADCTRPDTIEIRWANLSPNLTVQSTKLVASDAIESSNVNNTFPDEERKNIVRSLIQNKQVRDILVNGDVVGGATVTDNEPKGHTLSPGPLTEKSSREKVNLKFLYLSRVSIRFPRTYISNIV